MNEILTTKEVANYLGINLYQVYKLIESNKLKAFKIGGGDKRSYYRVTKEELNKFTKK